MDAILQMLIDARKKAARQIYDVYGGSTFGIGSDQYQVTSLNADGTPQTDANGYLTVKDLTTGKTLNQFDALTPGIVTTTPPTSTSLQAANPQLNPTNNTGGGSNVMGTVMGSAGLVMPAIGMLKGKGGGSGPGSTVPGTQSATQGPFFQNSGGVGPSGVPTQSYGGPADVRGSYNNYRTVSGPQPINSGGPQPINAGGSDLLSPQMANSNWVAADNEVKRALYLLDQQKQLTTQLQRTQRDLDLIKTFETTPQNQLNIQHYHDQMQDIQASMDKLSPEIGKIDLQKLQDNYWKAAHDAYVANTDQEIAQQNILATNKNTANALSHLNQIQGGYSKDLSSAGYTYLSSDASNPELIKAYSDLIKGGAKRIDLVDADGNPTRKLYEQVADNRSTSVLDHLPTQIELNRVSSSDIQNYLSSNEKVLSDSVKISAEDGMFYDDAGNAYFPDQVISKNQATIGAAIGKRSVDYNNKLEKSITNGQRTQFLGSLAGAGVASWGLFQSVLGMVENGKASAGGVIGAAGSMIGLATAMNYMHKALTNVLDGKSLSSYANKLNGLFSHGFLSHIPLLNHLHLGSVFQHMSGTIGTLAIMAAITLFAIFMGKKSAESQALEDFNQDVAPSVWNGGGVVMLSALGMASMGINLNPGAPMIQQIMVPQIQLTTALQKAAVNGSIPTDSSRYGTAFVQQGTNAQPTMVVYLTPGGVDSHGNALDVAHVTQLKANMKFTNPGSNGYIPFFLNDSNGKAAPNPMAVASVANQTQLLKVTMVGVNNTSDAQSLTTLAGTADKNNVDVSAGSAQ